ncbi:MAG TPA: AAA family ATPase [Ornithinicoccus sp.]|nr:AAA family ATPase [Ornithinicoccus sp.]
MHDVQPRAFVGRRHELDELAAALAAAKRHHGTLWVVTGEAGVGKSSLVAEFAATASSAGARVLWGRCREFQGAPPYWPWAQVLRPLLPEHVPPGSDQAAFADLLRPQGRATTPASGQQPEPDRFQFFDFVSRLVGAAAEEQPLVLIFEDMHAADAASVLLLHFVAAEVAVSPVLLVATTRPYSRALAAEGGGDTDLQASLHGTASHALHLGGLSLDELAVLLARWELPDDVVAEVWERTGGNPFFAMEIARSLTGGDNATGSGSALEALPRGVRLTLAERLRELDEDAQGVLALAAVCGRQFPVDVIALCCELPGDRVRAALDQAVRVGVLDRPVSDPGSYRFVHDLLREAVYAELAPERRMRLHGEVGSALVRLYGPSAHEHSDELARHFLEAAPVGYQREALDYAIRAGRRAAADLAYEQAGELLEKALDLVRLVAPRDVRMEVELELDAGHARLHAGDPDDAKKRFLAAARRAQRADLPDLLARAALGYGGQWSFTGESSDPRLVALLETALRHLHEHDYPGLRTRLLARLAVELYHSTDHSLAEESSARALTLARGLDDPAALASALLARLFVLWRPAGPERLQERLALDAEVRQLAAETGDPELELNGRAWRISDALENGDVVEAQEHMAAFARVAHTLRQPFYLWFVEVFASLHALMQGRYAEAEQHAEDALTIGRRGQGERELLENAMGAYTIHTLLIRREHGGQEPDGPVPQVDGAPTEGDSVPNVDGQGASAVDAVLDRFPRQPAWRAAMGLRLLRLGQEARARAHYEILAAHEFRALLTADASLIAISLTSELAATFGDAAQIGQLRDLLQPFAGRHVVIGHPAMAYQGCVDLYLGLLALGAEELEDAHSHLEEASRRHAAMGATPWVARADYHRARVHLRRSSDGDRETALRLLDGAEQIANELAMTPLLEQIAQLRADAADGVDVVPEVSSVAPLQGPAVFTRDGDVWTVVLGREATRISDLKGMHYLQRLLAAAGREFHALDLSTANLRQAHVGTAPQVDGLWLDSGDAGPLLDAQAKHAYRLRLEELRAEEAEAEELGHSERAGRAREEIDALAQELARAVGLGGRDRRAASQSERARVNVSRAIRAAIERIGQHAPSLGHHLDTTVRTGIYCAYVPDPQATPQWRTTAD